ncbi:MAG: LysE family transporter [Opitutae bacterium]|nr:LysE family transporter [Opitutae bacterium]
MLLLLKGFVIGFAVAAPIGPVGLLCIRRSIIEGKKAGIITGLGAAVADTLMAFVAVFGVTSVTSFITCHKFFFRLLGGALLVAMGLWAMRARAPVRAATSPLHAPNLYVAFCSTIVLTLANPMTILSLLGIFTFFGVMLHTDGLLQPSWLLLGVFLGSTAWWILLAYFAEWFGRKLNTNLLRSINIGVGALLLAFGLYELGRLAFG